MLSQANTKSSGSLGKSVRKWVAIVGLCFLVVVIFIWSAARIADSAARADRNARGVFFPGDTD